ncbi:apolipoprotein N-acyltransferase [Pedobacter chitinilyticus]|uniref:Apolipoprotein N-acyltransferase n=1 Tax=Pedobacter chitinilyticus TaxID=2233776 RepID=A0A3S3ST56_9SPHI|nr:apolipoprotein N-acyltransferase [Pedobacter chitinilyticus]RWU05627.1 apolipoprotein N-acyltransferase [Pedobacter chitinilyticus]
MTKKTTLLTLLSALVMWLAWPPHNWLAPLLFVGLVPLLIAINNIKTNAGKKIGKKIFLTAGLCFLVWNTASIYWVFNSINAVNTGFVGTIVSLLVSLIPYGLGALLMTFAVWMYYRLSTYTNKPIAYTGLIAFYISMEYLHQTWDLAFPWMTLGNGFAGMHQIVQWYEVTGVYGGSLWVLLSNILAFEAYQKIKNQKQYQLAGIWALLIILPIGYSLYRYYNYEEKSVPVNVVTVQPNIDPYEKFGSISANEQLNILTHLSDSVGQTNTEYFIWPETAIPNYADEERIRTNPDFLRAQQFLSKYKNGTLITGIESVRFYNDKKTLSAKVNPNGGYYDNYNAAMQVENSANVAFYHKSKLVPGVEKMPFPKVFSFLGPVFSKLGGSVSGWGWQEEPGVFYAYSGIGVAPVICYESIWGDWIAGSVKQGAQFIAIITNDGWWGNTSGKDQHLLYAKLRSIETRRYVVRSANTGISGFINQRGDVVQQSKWWTRTALKADINLNDHITFYVKHGDVVAIVSAILALLAAGFIILKKWFLK